MKVPIFFFSQQNLLDTPPPPHSKMTKGTLHVSQKGDAIICNAFWLDLQNCTHEMLIFFREVLCLLFFFIPIPATVFNLLFTQYDLETQ